MGQLGGLADGDVAAVEDAGAAGLDRDVVEDGHGLAREREERGSVVAAEGGGEGAGRLLGVAGADDVEAGDHAQAGDRLDRLVGGAVLADADGVVGVDVGDGQLAERGQAHGRAGVVGEHQEGGDGGLENAVVGDAVGHGGHGVLADAEADVAAGAVGGVEILVRGDVIQGRTIEVGRAADEQGQLGGEGLEHLLAGGAGGEFHVGGEGRDGGGELLGGHDGGAAFQQGGLLGVGGGPLVELLLPLLVVALGLLLEPVEVGADLGTDEEVLVGGQAETGARGVDELGAALAVALRGAGDLGDALGDGRLGDDEVGRSDGLLGLGDGFGDGGDIVAVDELHVPAKGLEALHEIVVLRLVGHRVEGDVVAVENDDEIIQLLVGGEGHGLQRDALLHAAVAGEGDHVAVEDRVRLGVEAGGGHLAGDREADGVGDALAEGAGGGLDAGGLMELGVAGGLGVELTEGLQLVEGEIVAAEVEPGVDEHRAVAGGEHEAVAVEPAGGAGAVRERAAEKGCADFGGAEGQAEVAGIALMDGVHGEATGLVGGLGEEGEIEGHREMGED